MSNKSNTNEKFKETEICLIPDDWKVLKLGDICEIRGGKRLPKGSDFSPDKTSHPYLRIVDFALNGIKKENLQYIDDEIFSKIKNYIIRSGDLYISIVGSIGLIGIVENDLDNASLTENAARLICSKNINNKFLLYYLRSQDCQDQINANSVGAVQKKLPIYGIKNLNIPLPSLSEQQKIAEVLGAMDDKIELNRKMNKSLESLGQAIFNESFCHSKQSKEFLRPLSEFGTIVCGKTPSKSNNSYFNGEIPFIKIPDMHGQTFILKTEDSLTIVGKDSQSDKTIPTGSICVSCIATVGLVSITTKDSQTNQQINSIIPAKKEYEFYLYFILSNLNQDLKNMASGGSATLNLNTGSFSKIEIYKPSEELLTIFDTQARPIFDQILNNAKEIETLSQIRDSLLPRLMSGKLRVE